MTTWYIQSLCGAISHRTFVKKTHDFYNLLTRRVWDKTTVEIDFFRVIPTHPTTLTDWSNFIEEQNKKEVFETYESMNFSDVTLLDAWEKAAYVRASFTPVDQERALSTGWAVMHFKGLEPKRITYYAQPEVLAEGIKKFTLEELDRLFICGGGKKLHHTHVSLY